jgi:hypothetical protein
MTQDDMYNFRTKEHSPQYNNYSNILEGITLLDSGGKPYKFLIYNPPDQLAVYSMTKYLSDEELEYINEIRKGQYYEKEIDGVKVKKPCPVLPRLASIGNGKYKEVRNQHERHELETRIFSDPQGGNIEKIINQLAIKNMRNEIFSEPEPVLEF